MLAASYQQSQQNNNVTQVNNQQPATTDPNLLIQQQQSVRLRDEPPQVVTAAPRNSRKRKTPPIPNTDQTTQHSQPPPPAAIIQHILPPPHSMVHPMQQSHPMPPGYPYDYTPSGMPIPHGQPGQMHEHEQSQSPPNTAAGRALSSSKRAEQNRKAQRAFRERRDQHVKALESRSQLLDAALASADEANRRWEECRALVDQLRIENAALRATLGNIQLQAGGGGGMGGAPSESGGPPNNNGSETVPSDSVAREEPA